MLRRVRIVLGVSGTIGLGMSLAVYLYAVNAPRKLQFMAPVFDMEMPPRPPFFWSLPSFKSVLLSIAFVCGIWVIAWKVRNRHPIAELLSKIGTWYRSRAYQVSALLTAVYLLAALYAWSQAGGTTPNLRTSSYGTPTGGIGTGKFIPFMEISGPEVIRSGESATIHFKLWVAEGLPDRSLWIPTLSAHRWYDAEAMIQAVNFEMERESLARMNKQPVSTDHPPAQWIWAIAPKAGRLGDQVIVIQAHIEDSLAPKENPYPYGIYLMATVLVLDPLGLPPSVVYGTMALGALLGVPLWGWLFGEWSLRKRERRESGHAAPQNSQ